ncbi:MAG: SAM-dependent methyltransferase [Bacteroidetes bacterium]|nr:MAG: SAM-dependent methyltransferase [Bacteroidota bacterium]
MYSRIKRFVLKIIPKSVLFRIEYPLRYLYYLVYVGNRFQCNICNKKLRFFVKMGNDRLCPRCGSIQRTRRLWKILNDEFLKNKQKILDFSPSRSIYRVMKKGDFFYVSSDLSGNFISDISYEIKNIDSDDQSYDLIICYHILEHIDNDIKAMKELWRVLKKDRYCLIQTPFKEGEIYEDNSITMPKEREIHFGQSDHVRIYSINDLKIRLENVGFTVEIRNFIEKHENIHGFSERETVLICYKPK